MEREVETDTMKMNGAVGKRLSLPLHHTDNCECVRHCCLIKMKHYNIQHKFHWKKGHGAIVQRSVGTAAECLKVCAVPSHSE